MNTTSTEELNARLIQEYLEQGREEAIDQLFSKYRSKIYHYILTSVKDPDLANDLMQETFIKVLTSIRKGQYKDNRRFEPWLIRVTHNLVMDHYRSKSRTGKVMEDSSEDGTAKYSAPEQNPEQKIISGQQKQEVRYLLEQLPEAQRQVVILRHFVGLSFQEIADHTNVSINTALGRMRYALINMRKMAKQREMLFA